LERSDRIVRSLAIAIVAAMLGIAALSAAIFWYQAVRALLDGRTILP
jgi:hypothetical protein